jgi:RNA-binding protein
MIVLQSAPFKQNHRIPMSLTSQQVRALRAESHRLKLKPVVMIGQNGLSENVVEELRQTLAHHELIKVRIPALERVDKQALITQICSNLEADLVQTIGHVTVLYRRNTKKDRFAKLL